MLRVNVTSFSPLFSFFLFYSYLAREVWRTLETASRWCGRRTSVLAVARNTDDVYDEAPSAYSYLNPTRFLLKTVRGHIAEGTPNNIVTSKCASILRRSSFRIASGTARNRLTSATRKIISYPYLASERQRDSRPRFHLAIYKVS